MYYQLDISGNVLGSFANPQPQLTPVPIFITPDTPGPGYQWNGSEWILSAQQAAENIFLAGLAAGYAVSPEGFTVAIDAQSRSTLIQALAAVNLALGAGAPSTTLFPLVDTTGVTHQVTLARFEQIVGGISTTYLQLWETAQSSGYTPSSLQ